MPNAFRSAVTARTAPREFSRKLRFVRTTSCFRFGVSGRTLLSQDCERHRFAFEIARSYGLYEGALVRAILMLMHEQIDPLGRWFAQRLADVVRQEGERLAADVIVPSAAHATRARTGIQLGRRVRTPPGVFLVHSGPGLDQHLLRNEERWEAVRGAFAMPDGGRVDNLRILLLDDVMTTGALLDACSRALREVGVKSVAGLTIARVGQPVSSFVGSR